MLPPAMPEPHGFRGGSVARGWRAALLGVLALGLLSSAAVAEPRALWRVGTSGDYAPFSEAKGRGYAGFDVELARRYAADRGLEIEWVRFRWPRLLRDLAAGRFEVAMSGVTITPLRSATGTFSVPLVETGAVALVRDPVRFDSLESLDRSHVRIAVNAGGHLESVARAMLSHATLVVIAENAAVVRALAAEEVDAAVTDTAEASKWEKELPGVRRLGPFTRDRKAFLVAADAAERSADLDAWLLEREADGTLAALRNEYLGAGEFAPVAEPLLALAAALDERLSLMPWVAVAKRRDGLPLVVPAREEAVLEEATAAVLAQAKAREIPPPSVPLVRGFFSAQLEAAKQVQRDVSRDGAYEAPQDLPDLDGALRPAISRIGARIARLLLALPSGTDRARIAKALADGLRTPWVSASSRGEIAEALGAFVAGAGAATHAPASEAAAPAQ
jgi:ABC-type amino acid transport substrate-binding protein